MKFFHALPIALGVQVSLRDSDFIYFGYIVDLEQLGLELSHGLFSVNTKSLLFSWVLHLQIQPTVDSSFHPRFVESTDLKTMDTENQVWDLSIHGFW